MSELDLELEAFSKFIVALEHWLGEAVLVGGWAHRLYRLDPRARKLDYPPLTTLDGDVAVPPKLKEQESTVRQRLTFMDKGGERVLRLLARNGAQFTASGIYTKRILEQLNLRR